MNSEAEQKYREFDWSSNPKWLAYLDNLFPTPSGSTLEKVKRKWYKKNIDSSLDIDSVPESSSSTNDTKSSTDASGSTHRQTTGSTDSHSNQNQSNANASQSSYNSSSQQNAPSGGGFLGKIGGAIGGVFGKLFDAIHKVVVPFKQQLYFAEGVLKFVFIVFAILLPGYANRIAFMINIMGMFRQLGRPYWNPEFGRRAFENEFLQNLFYMVPFLFFPGQKTLLYYLPLGIHYFIGLCEFINMKLPSINAKFHKYIDFTRQNKRILMFQKAKLEIMQFFFLIVLLFFGGSNIILLIFYGNFLKTKWMINAQTKSAFSEINNWVEGKINHRFCPGIVRFIVNKVRAFCAYMVRM